MVIALVLFTQLTAESSTLSASLFMLLLGLGMGMVMQVLVIAVQNAVDYKDLGTATSAAILFRLVGGAVGTAVLGGIFNSALVNHLAAASLTDAAQAMIESGGINPRLLANLTPPMREAYAQAFTGALTTAFLIAAGVALIGFILCWLLPELPLRQTVAASNTDGLGASASQAFPMPSDPDSLSLLLRGIVNLADRNVQRRYVSSIVARAGVDLPPLNAWLLVRVEENSRLNLDQLLNKYRLEPERIQTGLDQLVQRGLVKVDADNKMARYQITAEGCAIFNRLVKARRDQLAEMTKDWSEKERARIAQLIRELTTQLIPEIRPKS
jgi:DNA-binding MarR family transcriptional regulator